MLPRVAAHVAHLLRPLVRGGDDADLHNSDLRDSHEYIKKQVCGEQIITRQHRRGLIW